MVIFLTSCGFQKVDTKEPITVLSVKELGQRRYELDGQRIYVDAYLSKGGGGNVASYFWLTFAGEKLPNGNFRCASADGLDFYVDKVKNNFRPNKLDKKHVLISGVFKNEPASVTYESITMDYPGSLQEVHLVEIYDDICSL